MEAAERAAALDGGRTGEVTALARRARAELAARRRRDAARFGGLFSSKRYEKAAQTTAAEAAAADERDRRRASLALAPHVACEEERAAMEDWCALGAAAVRPEEAGPPPRRAPLMRLVRRAASAGGLEDGEARVALRAGGLAGGLAAAGDSEAEGMEAAEAAEAPARLRMARIRGLLAQAADGQALGADELALLAEYREEEVRRLSELRASPAGITQEEETLLAGLHAQQAAAAEAAERDGRKLREAEAALERLRVGAHVGPRERFNTLRLLEAEQARLSGLEESRGLRSDELCTLRELRKLFSERSARERMRNEQMEFLKAMQAEAQ